MSVRFPVLPLGPVTVSCTLCAAGSVDGCWTAAAGKDTDDVDDDDDVDKAFVGGSSPGDLLAGSIAKFGLSLNFLTGGSTTAGGSFGS